MYIHRKRRYACILEARPEAGFSLTELLVVIAIMSVLASFTVNGFKNIATSHGVGQAASDAASLLELARNAAVSRQAYVWVAFKEATNAGVLEVQMVAISSADGTANTAATNLVPLSRIVRARNCGLTNYSALKDDTRALLSPDMPTPVELSTSSGITFTNFSQSKFTNRSITFTPSGEAMLLGTPALTDGFNSTIGIGFVPARGNVKAATNSSDDAAVVLDGSTGIPRVLRL